MPAISSVGVANHHSLTDSDRDRMLQMIGVPSVEALFADIPEPVRMSRPLDLEPPFKGLEC